MPFSPNTINILADAYTRNFQQKNLSYRATARQTPTGIKLEITDTDGGLVNPTDPSFVDTVKKVTADLMHAGILKPCYIVITDTKLLHQYTYLSSEGTT